ncbi:MAG: hypothetical protein JWO84_593 [Parcubacteria group bacterium]|nr:hypothetical protein [Parcubacteria group bacterium]
MASLLAVLALGAFFYFHHPTPASSPGGTPTVWQTATSSGPTVTTITASIGPAPAGQKRYANTKFHLSLLYPDNLAVNEFSETSGALTVTFKKEDGSNGGFQIYATPYSDTQITSARFKLDEPSGVMKNPTPIVIDGVPASMFFSTNPIMGDTREVWFIRNGFLYEVTTYKELDAWLSSIMQTWKFL